ncbi:MAG: family 2 glycosyltransferase, dolichol-phosphate mannosyltransferase [Candidatus Gottesmanbacteria bacterium GW2011_GWA2_43_14]|uniref:Family 2 glycosyltransferase, dolichol-phosphate mannosyltransferase n=1 Tax=Candidatus Gottesmanbacteria bacterium GW2011_GWA2_43_14 TaxID=1618443 RepID=A0A0G1DME4_9BACT|nr:MAG: family 2 glycosyltransferase, dolichol-phosphate mannosyltransferase [Candidatus Gottesmanbacteria bacterium GW2011_GWA2_43_14]
MKQLSIKLSIILPTYNEAGNIIPLIESIRSNLPGKSYEIIISDDDSPDGTGNLAVKTYHNERNIKVIIRKKDKGLAYAIADGISKSRGEWIAVMDTDFNHDPQLLPLMLSLTGKYDLVIGSRYVKGGGMADPLRNLFSLWYNRLVRFVLRLPTNDNLCGYFMIRRRILKGLPKDKIFSGYGDYFIRLLFYLKKQKIRIIEIPAFYRERFSGKSKSRFLPMLINYTRTVVSLMINR